MGRLAQSCLVIALSACTAVAPDIPESGTKHPIADTTTAVVQDTVVTVVPTAPEGTVVLQTDSDEWRVYVFQRGMYYADAVEVSLPPPWVIPTKEDAQILHTLYFPNSERFITCDGFTFAMPSATVSKAGLKTKYSVLGVWYRPTVIYIPY